MEIARSNFSWIQENQLALFFKLCIEDYICGTSKTRKEFPDSPLDTFSDCFNYVLLLSKEICLPRKSQEWESSLEWMNIETRQEILDFINEKRSQFVPVYKHERLAKLCHLTDFDYNVKVSLSSSKMSDLSEPVTSLFLHTRQPKGGNKVLHIEMNTEELETLLFQLREAHQVMERLKE